MNIRIKYRTEYHYEAKVSFSPHVYRLFPRIDPYVKMKSVRFKTNARADVQYRRDLFDNEIACCFYPGMGVDLIATMDLKIKLREKNPFHFLLESHALEFPLKYNEHEMRVLGPFLNLMHGNSPAELPFWKPERKEMVAALMELNEAIYNNIAYERREEGRARDPAETLSLGVGSCRDYSTLLAETLRANGLAARLVSGYLCEFGEEEKRAEGAMHAWVEAYLPGAGWLGMDPTNGVLANHNHISTAVGLTPDDISPVTGIYFHPERVASKMDASLEIIKCDD